MAGITTKNTRDRHAYGLLAFAPPTVPDDVLAKPPEGEMSEFL